MGSVDRAFDMFANHLLSKAGRTPLPSAPMRTTGTVLIVAGALALLLTLPELYFSLRYPSKSWVRGFAWASGDAYRLVFSADLRIVVVIAALAVIGGVALLKVRAVF